jgi:hypothetical protein
MLRERLGVDEEHGDARPVFVGAAYRFGYRVDEDDARFDARALNGWDKAAQVAIGASKIWSGLDDGEVLISRKVTPGLDVPGLALTEPRAALCGDVENRALLDVSPGPTTTMNDLNAWDAP